MHNSGIEHWIQTKSQWQKSETTGSGMPVREMHGQISPQALANASGKCTVDAISCATP